MATERDEAPSSTGSSQAGRPDGSAPGDAAPPARSSDPVRRALLLTPVVAIVVGIAVVLANLPAGEPLPSAGPSGSGPASPGVGEAGSRGYLVTLEELRRRGELAARGEEPYEAAVEDLLAWAEGAIDEDPRPSQPLLIVGTDNPFVDDASRAYGLGLAYGLTGEERFARAARRTIRAWTDTATTTANTCPDGGGCHTSLILGRAGPGFAFGADLIAGSEAWTDDDRAVLQAWMRDVLLPAASIRPNNWGDAGTFLRVVAADYAGDQPAFEAAIEKWRSLIDLIEADGRIPEEVRRGSAGILYTQEALQYKVAVARIAEARGIDLWDYVGAQGGSLRAALDRLAYYWSRPEEWPDYPRARVPSTGPVWEIAYAKWQEPLWVEILLEPRPYGDRGHSAIRWTTLTNGIPVEPLVAGGGSPGPSGSLPAASATPPGSPAPTASPTADLGAVPAVTGFAVRLGSPFGSSVPVTVRWDVPNVAGATVELERSAAGGSWEPLAIGDSGQSARDAVRPGESAAWRVRAVVAAAAGPWTSLTDVAATRIELSARTAELGGSWDRVSFGDYSSGVALSTNDGGATVTWRGTTQAIAIVGPMGPTRGRMVVTIDGVEAGVVDLYADDYRARALLFETSWRSAGHHEVTIEAVRVGGRRTVAVDDIVTLVSTLSAEPG